MKLYELYSNTSLKSYYGTREVMYVLAHKAITDLPLLEGKENFLKLVYNQPIVRKYQAMFEGTQQFDQFLKYAYGHYTKTEKLDEDWKKWALSTALAAGIFLGAAGGAKGDEVKQASFEPTTKQEQVVKVVNDLDKFVNTYLDWGKLPWYAPDKDTVKKKVADAYIKALKDGESADTIISKVSDYLKAGGDAAFKNMYHSHAQGSRAA